MTSIRKTVILRLFVALPLLLGAAQFDKDLLHHEIVCRCIRGGSQMLCSEGMIPDNLLRDPITETEAVGCHQCMRSQKVHFASGTGCCE